MTLRWTSVLVLALGVGCAQSDPDTTSFETQSVTGASQAAVTGGVLLRGASTETVLPFTGTLVTAAGDQTTDLGGNYTYAGGTATTTLGGPWFHLADSCRPPNVATDVAPGDLALGTSTAGDCSGVGPTTPTTRAGRSAIYHLENARRLAAKWLSSPWLATDVEVDVNDTGPCNAFWDGDALHFFHSGNDCANTGELADIVVHEWAHGLDQHAGSPGDRARAEAIADTVVLLTTHDACIAPGYYPTSNNGETTACASSLRDLRFPVTAANIAAVCPTSTTCSGALGYECHCESHLLSGAHWALAQSFVQRYGVDEGWQQFEHDFFRALPLLASYIPNTPNNAYDAWLAADDDNGDLTDGTPNADLIYAAFNARGIASGSPRPSHVAACASRPAPPVVTATPSATGVALSWTADPGVTSYAIYRTQAHADGAGFLPIATVTNGAYTDLEVRPDLAYTYQVVATTGACTSPFVSATPVVDDFAITLPPITVPMGSSTSIDVTTATTSGAPQPVTLSLGALPAGVSGTFAPSKIMSGQVATLTLTATAFARPIHGSYTVTGTGAAASHTVVGAIAVVPDDFAISVAPSSVALAPGASASVSIATAVTAGAAQPIALSIANLPSGVTATFAPSSVIAGGRSTLTLAASVTAPPTSADFLVTGTSTSSSHTAGGTVAVRAAVPLLTNGVPVANLSGRAGQELRFALRVPANQTSLVFSTSGGAGDVDLYVKRDEPPTTTSYDCRSQTRGTAETCALRPVAGTWYVTVRSVQLSSGVSLVGTYR